MLPSPVYAIEDLENIFFPDSALVFASRLGFVSLTTYGSFPSSIRVK
jgi:hypothetical protein